MTRLRLTAGLAALVVSTVAFAATTWLPLTDDDGVQSARRPGSAGAPPVYRAVTKIEASVLEVLAVLNDDGRRTEWMARCVEARLVSRRDRFFGTHYSRLSAPWPLSQRDVIVEARIRVSPASDSASVEMTSVDALPQTSGRVVRVPHLEARFQLDAVEPGRTRLEYQVAVDLGGNVPSVLTSRVREEIAFDTVRNLRRFVPAEREGYLELVADWRARLAERAGHSTTSQPARLTP